MADAGVRLRSRTARGSTRGRSSASSALGWRSGTDVLVALRDRLATLPYRMEPNDPLLAAVLGRVLQNVQLEVPGAEPVDIEPVRVAPTVAEFVLTDERSGRILVELKVPETGSYNAGSQQRRTLIRALDDIDTLGGDDPLRVAFLVRCLRGLARLAPTLDPDTLCAATSAGTDLAALLQALEAPAALEALTDEDPLTEARLRDVEVREGIRHAEGGLISAEAVGRRLGVTRQAIDRRRRAGSLLALPVAAHRYGYPAWQFVDTRVLPGLEEVLPALNVRDPWTIAGWFLGENSLLDGERPLDVLRGGNVTSVRRAAALFGEQGAG